jgi:BatD DUF11 like domain
MVIQRASLGIFWRGLILVSLLFYQLWAAEVELKLDRDSVGVGDGALLTLRITGSRVQPPELPEVENLIIQPRGRRQETQMSNGQVSSSLVLSYVIGSNTAGDYQIPAFEVSVDGQKLLTQVLKLVVLADGKMVPPAVQNSPASGTTGPVDPLAKENPFGFLTVDLVGSDRKYVYLGEIAPVCIRAWFPADSRAALRSGIQPEAKAFTLHHVSERPQQSEEVRDGQRFLVVTWYGGISATKAGSFPASLSLQANVAVKDESAPAPPRRSRGGPFDDPFFDSAFDRMNTRYIQKDVVLKSLDQGIEVRALPEVGRPNNFSGAIGEFALEPSNIPSTGHTGEPQTIRASVSGSGNFALVAAPQLTPQDDWKVYPGKDQFTPHDEASFSGVKQFEFSALPRKAGRQEAALSFSYFDPAVGEYKTLVSPAVQLEIQGQDVIDPIKHEEKKEVASPKPAGPTLVQKLEDTAPHSLQPLVATAKFAPLIGTAVGLSLCGGLLAMGRKRRENPQRRALLATQFAIRESLRTAGQRAAAKDVAGFFQAARQALQERLASMWNQPAQAITLAEVSQRLAKDSPVLEFFQIADLHQYSASSDSAVFVDWQQLLQRALAAVATPG